MYSIWTEKYRPKELKDVVGQDQIVKTIAGFIKSKRIPHLLFSGPAGCGKSTTALIVAEKFFGRAWKQNFLELNASDQRGIDIIRTNVKDFARTRPLGDVPFKMIFLDEADSLTPEAQNALRRTIENYTNTCRFILSCNYSSKIIDPIQSRCAVFRFKNVPQDDLKKRLNYIIGEEKINVDPKALDAIYKISEGDVRKAVNILQAAATNSKNVKENTIYDVSGVAQPVEVKEMLNYAVKGKFPEARKILLDLLYKHGISGHDLIRQISTQIHQIELNDKDKMKVIKKIGEYEFRLNQGANEQIQLEALIAQFCVL